MVEPGEIAIVAIVFGTIGVIGYPVARALAARIQGKVEHGMLPSSDLTDRLDRIEHAVDAMALEVERMSEGQRFVTRLLAEQKAPSGALPPAPPASAS